MKINWTLLLLSLILCVFSPTYGRINFRKLSATEVYNALREAGRLDAVPEGRVITQGIAAVTGFLAGVTKGIAIPMFSGLVSTSNSSSNIGPVALQICYSSRGANEIVESEKANNTEKAEEKSTDNSQGRQITLVTPATALNETEKAKNNESAEEKSNDSSQGRQDTPTPTTTTGTTPGTTGPTTTTTSPPGTTTSPGTTPSTTTPGTTPPTTATFPTTSTTAPTTPGTYTYTSTGFPTSLPTTVTPTATTPTATTPTSSPATPSPGGTGGTGGNVKCIIIRKPAIG